MSTLARPRRMAMPKVRYTIKSDIPHFEGFNGPYTSDRVDVMQRASNVVCYTAVKEVGSDPWHAGYMLLVYHKDAVELLEVGVNPDMRRTGVGRALLLKSLAKLSAARQTWFTLVPDTATEAHLWLRGCGFKAVGVERGRNGERDHYRFEARYEEREQC
jgi:N-acetylglutamate synthase-like GNAT family acetyltransferase